MYILLNRFEEKIGSKLLNNVENKKNLRNIKFSLKQEKNAQEEINLPIDSVSSDLKCVLVVRMDLKMGKGKIAAQCGHAVAMMIRRAGKYVPKILEKYERAGQKKVVVKVDDEDGLDEVVKKALESKLLTNVVHDAGHTQVAAGSKTVCCIGPANGQIIDSVTGHLKLL